MLHDWDFHNSVDLQHSTRSIASLQYQVSTLTEEKKALELHMRQLRIENAQLRNASTQVSNPLRIADILLKLSLIITQGISLPTARTPAIVQAGMIDKSSSDAQGPAEPWTLFPRVTTPVTRA
jgi:hypothetical protein